MPAADDERARRAEAAKLRLKQFQSGRAARTSLDGRPPAIANATADHPPETHDAARLAFALSRRSSRQSEAEKAARTPPKGSSPPFPLRASTARDAPGRSGHATFDHSPALDPTAHTGLQTAAGGCKAPTDLSDCNPDSATHTGQSVLVLTPAGETHPGAESESTQSPPSSTPNQQPAVEGAPHPSTDLKIALDDANAKLASYEVEIATLRNGVSVVQHDERAKSLEQDLLDEKARAHEALEAVTKLEREAEEARCASVDAHSKLAKLAQALNIEQTNNATLVHEAEELRKVVFDEQNATLAMQKELSKISATCKELTAVLASEKEKRLSSDSRIEELEKVLEAEKQLAAKAQSEFTTVHAAGSELKAALIAEKEKVAQWEQEIDKLRREMEEMERDAARRRDADAARSSDSTAELQLALDVERKHLAELRSENTDLLGKLESLKRDLDARSAAEEGLRTELRELESVREIGIEELRTEFLEKVADAVASADRYRAEADEWRLKCESMTRNIEHGHEEEKARALLIRAESEEEVRALKDTLAMEDESLTVERARTADLEKALAAALDELRSRPGPVTLEEVRAEAARRATEAAAGEKASMEQEIENLRAALAEMEAMRDSRRPASPGSSGRSTSNSGTSSDSARDHGGVSSDSLARRFAALQAENAALQAELERVRLAQADIGPLLLRTGMAPSVNETVASFQRRCDELSVLVQAAEKERNVLKAECERLRTAAWDGERAGARAQEVASEMSSLREGIERERGLWVAKEELMKADLVDTKDQLTSYAKLLENLWGTLQDDLQSADEPAKQRRRERGGWRNGALEKALANLLDDRKRIRESEAEAHQIIDLQHEKIERMLKGEAPYLKPATPTNTAVSSSAAPPRSSRDGSPMPGRYALDYFESSAAAPAVQIADGATQTDPMLAYQRIATLKARLTELGTIWKLPHLTKASSPPPEDPEARLSHLAAAHAEIQSAHSAALQRVASLEASLGNAKRLVVALSTGADADRTTGSGAGEDDEVDEEVWMRKCLALEGDARQLEDEVRRWRERAEELEEIVEEWSLGSATSP
ncbi:hypothetical protein HDU86_002987 [Geranomyces michiganensis]|nr:hypothetical protein HDU86_002987 [Geranomyces michiganensis]